MKIITMVSLVILRVMRRLSAACQPISLILGNNWGSTEGRCDRLDSVAECRGPVSLNAGRLVGHHHPLLSSHFFFVIFWCSSNGKAETLAVCAIFFISSYSFRPSVCL